MTITSLNRTNVDPRDLRNVCGDWITGISIVTSSDSLGNPVGMAVNSFTSLSLDPPLILFCPAKKSSTWPQVRMAGRFVVNILSSHQGGLSRAFAQSGGNKFAGVDFRAEEGLPILNGAAAHLVCTLVDVFEGGDHEIAVGRVDSLERSLRAPLVFHRGRIIENIDSSANES